jgi:hypothetical protein
MFMSFRGRLKKGIQPETRRGIDIFCRSDRGLWQRVLPPGWGRVRPISTGGLPFVALKSLHCLSMSHPAQPNVKTNNAPDYRETYANSVQIRVNVWDFFMVFGTVQSQTEAQVEIRNFQGIYLSPQQAKALLGLLQQNVSGYESAFGEIKLDPRMTSTGPVH